MNYEEVKDKALTFLEYRSHTEKELSDKLRRKGAEEEDIERVIEFLKEYKFINDEDYARRYAHDLVNLKKFGAYRIRRELLNKGIDGEIVEMVMSELDTDEQAALMPLLEKKLGGDFERKSVDRAIRYFISRGYSYDDIRSCISEIKRNEEEYGI